MREKFISALAYPRTVVRDDILPDDCPHDHVYNSGDRHCQKCGFDMECAWLYRNDEFSALQLRPLAELVDALEFSLGYVQRRTVEARHNHESCRCTTCTWSREAEALIDAFRHA